ncbi:TIGR02646 family protein [Deltaproteobacteria bacterium Smac51]|nr:TIGR02646 family protein [Deltaproteobacteria bacterium Smac51]
MRRLSSCDEPETFTQARDDFVELNPHAPHVLEKDRWKKFKSAHSQGYAAAQGALLANQYGLCAYCEADIKKPEWQIEHFKPKSETTQDVDLTFDFSNFLLCCQGGTDDAQRKNHSCGQSKRNTNPVGNILNPYELPYAPIVEVTTSKPNYGDYDNQPDFDGLFFKVNEEACKVANIDIKLLKSTIKYLHLNCPRLARRRIEIWRQLEQEIKKEIGVIGTVISPQDLAKITDLAKWHLSPRDNRLEKFQTAMVLFFASYLPSLLTEGAWQEGNSYPTV